MPSKNYHKIKDGNVFACDIDDTLISWAVPSSCRGEVLEFSANGFLERCIPNKFVIEHIKKMKKRHYSIVIWSAGGSNWAEDVVKALGLQPYVDLIMPKIDEHMDDVRDPKDKIGRWSFIDLEGNVQRESLNGEIKKYKLTEGE